MKIISLGKITFAQHPGAFTDGVYLLCRGTHIDAKGATLEEIKDWLFNFLDPSEQLPNPVWWRKP